MRTLLIDNHDSYTYNLFQLIAQVYGEQPVVLTNDDHRLFTVDLSSFDAVIVSPGPGHPGRQRDLGVARRVITGAEVPVLGVCLGHQAIALLAGADVVGAPRPRHGHLTKVRHEGEDLFDGLPQDFVAVRYHSLCVPSEGLPDTLEPTAWAEDGVLMGLRHRTLPRWGVQFHPESVATEHGERLIANFGRLAAKARAERGLFRPANRARAKNPVISARPRNGRPWHVLHRELPGEVDTAAAFKALFGAKNYAFWLDSSRVEAGLSRFSYLGAPEGRDGEVLTYDLAHGLTVTNNSGTLTRQESVFDALRLRLTEPVRGTAGLPFDLASGYVGYFGYELKAELGSPNRHHADTPDAVWMSANRLLVVDHELQRTHLVAVARTPADPLAQEWLAEAERRVRGLPAPAKSPAPTGPIPDPKTGLVRPVARYLDDIAECQRYLHAGESYEICLTTRIRLPRPADTFSVYLAQRRTNPAPYAAYLKLGETAVLCSSPERFLRILPDRTVEAKPIKGTTPRHADPELDAHAKTSLTGDPKAFAENLMIVDLLRNDLGRVCDVGSVHVPSLMAVESYATVHQLVSTVRGRLRQDVDVVTCVQACFPGGSMTGAPKLRTMEIIDQLETTARGVYSGALGFLSRTGTADLNIVIRTAVAHGETLSVGAGGAIVLDSDPSSEVDEMLLKARAPLGGLAAVRPPQLIPARKAAR